MWLKRIKKGTSAAVKDHAVLVDVLSAGTSETRRERTKS